VIASLGRDVELPRRALLVNGLAILLLLATAAAFVFAEVLKLEKSPIAGTEVSEAFSPVCGCATSRARISFRLRHDNRVTLQLFAADGEVVRTLVRARRFDEGRVSFRWDGRDDSGRLLPDGAYRPRVELADADRTFDLPNRIQVDSTPPELSFANPGPWKISPDRDGHADRLVIRYRLNEPASVSLTVDGVRRGRIRGMPLAAKLAWSGRVGGRPQLGVHRLVVLARDSAGNVSRAGPQTLRVRLVALRRHRFVVRRGARLRIAVDTDASRVSWRLGTRHGRGSPHPLVLRAPDRRGRYALTVRVRGQTARARVRVIG